MHSVSDIEGILATQALLPSQIRAPRGVDFIVGDDFATLITSSHISEATIQATPAERAEIVAKAMVEVLAKAGAATTFISPDGYVRAGWRLADMRVCENVSTIRALTFDRLPTFDFVADTTTSVDVGQTNALECEVDSIRTLTDGWAGEGSLAPAQESFDYLSLLLSEAKLGGWIPARVFVSPDGELGLAWEAGSGYASVSFWNDGGMSYYARSVDGSEERGAEVSEFAGASWPDDLMAILRSFA